MNKFVVLGLVVGYFAIFSVTGAELIIAVPSAQQQQFQQSQNQHQQFTVRSDSSNQFSSRQQQFSAAEDRELEQLIAAYETLLIQKHKQKEAAQQEAARSWDLAAFLPIASQDQPSSGFSSKRDSDGAISITIKLEPQQLRALQNAQDQSQANSNSQPQYQQQQYQQKLQSQASQNQNTIVAVPQQPLTVTDLSYDSQQGFWKELKGILGGLTGSFSKSQEKPAAYIPPNTYSSPSQNKYTGQKNINQAQNNNNGLFRTQQLNTMKQPLIATPNPYPPNNYLLQNPNPTTPAPTAEENSSPPMVRNIQNKIAHRK